MNAARNEVRQALLQRVAAGADLLGIEDDVRRLMKALDVVDSWQELKTPMNSDSPSFPCEKQ